MDSYSADHVYQYPHSWVICQHPSHPGLVEFPSKEDIGHSMYYTLICSTDSNYCLIAHNTFHLDICFQSIGIPSKSILPCMNHTVHLLA